MTTTPQRVAVVGSGVSGLTAAYVASRTAHVTLYEADERLGGHADTHLVTEQRPDGDRVLAIDTGFIVHNPRTYPVLLRLFAELGVATQPSEMSMSIRDDTTGLEWAGALGRRGVFPTPAHLRNPRYLRMLTEIPRFHRRARRVLAGTGLDTTLREFLAAGRFSAYFTRHFMEPLVASVWSCEPRTALDYPARYLFAFLEHHGMLRVFGSPQWRTVTGGSATYVAAVAARLQEVRTGAKVTSVLETADGVEVTDGNGAAALYDAVVIATHPGQALAMLAEPTPPQRSVLEAMPYSPNVALLHTDDSVLPRVRNAWASWNFARRATGDDQLLVTYDLTRLQRLDTDIHYLVTLVGAGSGGGEGLVDPAKVVARMEYEHPLYNPGSVAAQSQLAAIDTERVSFAGAYHGWGFHEDGARSGLAAVERLGLAWPEGRSTSPADAVATGIYETTIRHTRRTPFRRHFTHRSHLWLVDLDDTPDHGVLGRFEARDHLAPADGTGPRPTIRANLEAFLAEHDIDLRGGRAVMAANARALGYCFNPISVHWCWDAAGKHVATVVEVHNTYGDRHAYLVHPDDQGRATVAKAMYVSPFHGTDGSYDLHVPVPREDRLDIVVNLTTEDGSRFHASLSGRRTALGPRRAAPAAIRGAVLMRMHGIRLWLRRLPVQPRPAHPQKRVR